MIADLRFSVEISRIRVFTSVSTACVSTTRKRINDSSAAWSEYNFLNVGFPLSARARHWKSAVQGANR